MQTMIKRGLDRLSKGESLVLATVISHKGSTPRGTGTRLLILENGTTVGTIGGGLVELKVIETALALFQSKKSTIFDYDMSASHLKADSMICGGAMSVLIEFMQPDDRTLELFRSLQQCFNMRQEALLIINLDELKQGQGQTSHALVADGRTVFSFLPKPLPVPLLTAEMKSALQAGKAMIGSIGEMVCWIEALQFPKKLTLFGAGHVARPTAELGARTGFQTTVVDDRGSILSHDYFSNQINLIQIDTFEKCQEAVKIDQDSFVVILTRGHKSDKTVLAQVLKTDAAYIGMIGSRKKRNTIYQLLLEEGFSQQDLDRVHCPVGIDIGAETPEEIAVSIMAELIQERAHLS